VGTPVLCASATPEVSSNQILRTLQRLQEPKISDSKRYWTLTVNLVDPLSCLKWRDGCDHGKGGFGAIELLVLSMTP
jgi:hypothetical protein